MRVCDDVLVVDSLLLCARRVCMYACTSGDCIWRKVCMIMCGHVCYVRVYVCDVCTCKCVCVFVYVCVYA